MKKQPTPAQERLLEMLNQEGVERRCFISEHPGHVKLNWQWVSCKTQTLINDRTISACEKMGLVKVQRGQLKPETPEGLSPLQIVLGKWREPDLLLRV